MRCTTRDGVDVETSVLDLEFLLFMVTRYKLRNLSCNFFTDQEPETYIFF